MAVQLYSEINILCVVMMVIIAVKAAISGFDKSTKDKMFISSVLFATLANIMDFLWNLSYSKMFVFPSIIMQIINFIYFTSFSSSAYCWFMYTDLVYNKDSLKNKKRNLLYMIPGIVLIVLLIISHFNGCLYYFDEFNNYHRGNLYYLQQILSYSLFVVSSIKCLINAFRKKYFIRRNDFITLSAFIIPPIVCGIIQIILQSIPILSVGIVVSFLIAYINSVEQKISLDPLTGIPNRRDLMRQLSEYAKALKTDEKLYFLFCDVDKFKQINDNFGHNEGDRVLIELALALKKYSNENNGYCGRYGGDEFALILKVDKNDEINSKIAEINKYIREQNITANGKTLIEVSVGYSCYNGSIDSIQELISLADEHMYSVKSSKK